MLDVQSGHYQINWLMKMLLLVVGKCSVCDETAKEDTTWGDEICLPTKSIHLFLWSNPKFSLVKWCKDKPGWLGCQFRFLLFVSILMTVLACAHSAHIVFIYQLLSDAESVRWLNHAINKMWPICMQKIVSQLLRPIIPWFLDKFKPWTVVQFPSFILIF